MSTYKSEQEREPTEPEEPDEPGTMPEEAEGVTPPEWACFPRSRISPCWNLIPRGPKAPDRGGPRHAAGRASSAAASSCSVHQ